MSLKSESFYIDTITYKEGKQIQTKSLYDFEETELTGVNHQEIEDCPIRSFSIKWPYVAYTNSEYLIVINAFHTNNITRVKLLSPDVDHQIVQTCITNSNDLLSLVKTNDEYILFLINLDKSNIHELDEDENKTSVFEPDIIYRYKISDVKNKDCLSLHARGSTSHEILDIGNKLMVFFHHGDTLFSWTQLYEGICMTKPIEEVGQISSSKMESS